ncbi:(d)CMP kinase [Telmatocola sphagniphila]|uniref:Cytidylate kinase n=1 Tax=Telmatocola sphagniphila TaxID=1123043 RepID=A0A8E6EY24_9BACT|nr:(d)CMP kinase [Telmatocola sphagniphila]QVL32243.1 (d)CMP kinase [Telmatocola sphagniphila]
MIVTIDGPAGSGKSTAARALAKKIGYEFLDTGAMYRAVAYYCLCNSIPWEDHSAVAAALPKIQLDMPLGRILLNGVDVSQEIRSSQMAEGSSKVAVIHAVREFLVAQQQAIGRGRRIVTEGRDQGTVVFPEAELKVFLVASPESRARRRFEDLQKRGETVSFEDVLKKQYERDKRDSERAEGRLVAASDALTLDTTDMSIEEVIELLIREVEKRCPRG